jgi:hypothetical protein
MRYTHERFARFDCEKQITPNSKYLLDNIPMFQLGLLIREDGTDTLCRNVGKQLPHDAA